MIAAPGPALGKPSKSASRFSAPPWPPDPPDELAGSELTADELAELAPANANESQYLPDFEPCDPDDLAPAPGKWRMATGSKKLNPEHRIQFCHTKVAFGRQTVDVMKKNDSVYFRGVHRCGSVWACPVCSAQISEGRRRELQEEIDTATGQGRGVSLATFTFSHGLHDALADQLPRFTRAKQRLKSGRAWQAIKTEFGIAHTTTANEVTHGNNGWHPHQHELLYTNEPLSAKQLEALHAAIFPLWLAACKKAGLPAPNAERGVQIQNANHAAQYVGKFGFASELTRSQSKRGKLAGRTQWDLLRDYVASNGADLRSGELFKEYVEAFSGKRQLVRSRGLREWLRLGELFTDEQLAVPDDTQAEVMAELDLDTFALIARGDWFEDVVEKAKLGRDTLLEFLNWLRDHCPLWDGRIVGAKPLADWRPSHDRRERGMDELQQIMTSLGRGQG